MARESISTTEELKARVSEGGIVALKCMSTQCLRCPVVGDLLLMLQSTHKFDVVDCDVHAIEEDLYEVLQVTKLPTLILYRAGVELARGTGIWQAQEIKSLINDHCEACMPVDEDF